MHRRRLPHSQEGHESAQGACRGGNPQGVADPGGEGRAARFDTPGSTPET